MLQKMQTRVRNLFRRNRHRGRPTKHVDDDEEDKGEPGDPGEPGEPGEQKAEMENERVDIEIIPPPPEDDEMNGYFHVGRSAKECLINGFKLGAWQLMCASSTSETFHLTSFGEAYPGVRQVFGGVEAYKEFGNFHLSQCWFTTQEYLTELGVRGSIRSGHLYGLLMSLMDTKEKVTFQGKFKCGLERRPVKMELMVPIYHEPLLMGYIVLAPLDCCMFGYRTVYNLGEKAFDMHAFCLGFNNGRTEVGLKLENFKNLRGSLFQRINDYWAFAVKTNLYSSENVKQLVVGGQYDFQNGTILKARVREDLRFGFVYQAKVKGFLDVMYHLGFDLNDPKNGAHRIGASLEFHF